MNLSLMLIAILNIRVSRSYFTSNPVRYASWSSAKSYCDAQGGSIASIHSQDDQDSVLSLLRAANGVDDPDPVTRLYGCWIGLIKNGTNWVWTDGTSLDYIKWNSGQPNGGDCVWQHKGYAGWSDVDCTMTGNLAVCNDRTPKPSVSPSRPSETPTIFPSVVPTKPPSEHPSSSPTLQPSGVPSTNPTVAPTENPTRTPTRTPTQHPSNDPTAVPTQVTMVPSSGPSLSPSSDPSVSPSSFPSLTPSSDPSVSPSFDPSVSPSSFPSLTPSSDPSVSPSFDPTSGSPTAYPSLSPTEYPNTSPSSDPTTFIQSESHSTGVMDNSKASDIRSRVLMVSTITSCIAYLLL
eukprot:339299_1